MGIDFSSTGLLIQWLGTLLILGLLVFLTQSIRRPALDYWAAAWCCLALALCALTLDLQHPLLHRSLRAGYFLGEYGFGYLLIAGCRVVRDGSTLRLRALGWLPLALAITLALTLGTDDFHLQFALHALVMSILFWTAFAFLRGGRSKTPGPGLTVMVTALLLLGLDFLLDVPVFWIAARRGPSGDFADLNYTSTIDLVLGTVLGFGIVMFTLDSLRREAETARRELALLARTDPLTSALNRHAYDSLRREPGGGGCVVLADLNGLKHINDRSGHLAGDMAIRQTASSIRSVIRADDYLFRWGGDEFLVVLPHLEEAEARRRFETANQLLREVVGEGSGPGLTLSYGTAAFGGPVSIDQAIALADERMYLHKQTAPRL